MLNFSDIVIRKLCMLKDIFIKSELYSLELN